MGAEKNVFLVHNNQNNKCTEQRIAKATVDNVPSIIQSHTYQDYTTIFNRDYESPKRSCRLKHKCTCYYTQQNSQSTQMVKSKYYSTKLKSSRICLPIHPYRGSQKENTREVPIPNKRQDINHLTTKPKEENHKHKKLSTKTNIVGTNSHMSLIPLNINRTQLTYKKI